MKYLVPLAFLGAIAFGDWRGDYERAADSAVFVRAGDSGGSGVFVSPRHVLTAYHVIEGAADIRILAPIRDGGVVHDPARYGKGMKCRLVDSAPNKDLALLEVDGEGGMPMPLGETPAAGDAVFTVGNGDGVMFRYMEGTVRSVMDDSVEFPGRMLSGMFIDHSAPINLGDSGAPLISGGRLVGINVAICTGMNQVHKAVDISDIRSFLEGARAR